VIAVCVLIFLWQTALGEREGTLTLYKLGMIPVRLLGGEEFPPELTVVPAWATVFTSMFMHGGWLHLLGNMWFLWIFGNNVEDSMGHLRFAVFYLLCGLAAAALQLVFTNNPQIPMVGASGAIGGVMGAYILLYPRVQVHLLIFLGIFITTIAVPAIFMLGYWFVLQLLGGFTTIGGQGGGVAFWAHIGGFVAGSLLIFLFRNPRLLARHPYHGWKARSPHRSWERL
jgi:membrane associated rhomboid family serine protease